MSYRGVLLVLVLVLAFLGGGAVLGGLRRGRGGTEEIVVTSSAKVTRLEVREQEPLEH